MTEHGLVPIKLYSWAFKQSLSLGLVLIDIPSMAPVSLQVKVEVLAVV